MAPRLGTKRSSAVKPKPLAGILRIPRATPCSPAPNQQVAFLHEASTPVGSTQSAYEGVYNKPDEGKEAFVVEKTDPSNSIATSDLLSTVHGDKSSIQDAMETGNGEQLLWLEQMVMCEGATSGECTRLQSRMKMGGLIESDGSQSQFLPLL